MKIPPSPVMNRDSMCDFYANVQRERALPFKRTAVPAGSKGTAADRFIVQAALLAGGLEGGSFTMIGRKKP